MEQGEAAARGAQPRKGWYAAVVAGQDGKLGADIGSGIAPGGAAAIVAVEARGIAPRAEKQLAGAERRLDLADGGRAVAMAEPDRGARRMVGVAAIGRASCRARVCQDV